jgi:hypothetical protein
VRCGAQLVLIGHVLLLDVDGLKSPVTLYLAAEEDEWISDIPAPYVQMALAGKGGRCCGQDCAELLDGEVSSVCIAVVRLDARVTSTRRCCAGGA